MNKQHLLLAGLFLTGGLHAYPTINNECANPNLNQQECTNDPLLNSSYEMDMMNFSYAWDKSHGTARIGIIDTPINLYSLDNTFGKIREHDSGQYACHPPGTYAHYNVEHKCVTNSTVYNYDWYYPEIGEFLFFTKKSHGDMIYSQFGSVANDGQGMSSVCRDCTLAVYGSYDINISNEPSRTDYAAYYQYMENKYKNVYNSFRNAVSSGNQIINKSGYMGPVMFEDCDYQASRGNRQSVCDSLELAKELDVIVVASNGNTKGVGANWPANETDLVIGVGGTDIHGNIWEDLNCPFAGSNEECGSQLNATNIMAPAKNVTVHHENGSYNPQLGCIDSSGDGYQTCTGTSFSAPIVSGVIAIMRSMNPLLSFDQIKTLLSNSGIQTDAQGRTYSIPNIKQIMKHDVIGKVNGLQVSNRVKPMFRLHYQYNHLGSPQVNYLSTSIPQVAASAWRRQYLANINPSNAYMSANYLYRTDNTEPLAVGYPRFRQPNMENLGDNARAPFYIFGGHENPFTGADDMIPLYHYAMLPNLSNNPSCYDRGDHAYGTKEFSAFTNMAFIRCNTEDTRYVKEGIEGYMLPNCPETNGCYEHTGNIEAPQCLMLRFSATDNSYALLMESELNKAKFSTYTQKADHLMNMEDAECLGYVYPNIDSDNDLIIDGMEAILGTDPLDNDTDGDGRLDGAEYPPTGPVVSDPLVFNQFSWGSGG